MKADVLLSDAVYFDRDVPTFLKTFALCFNEAGSGFL
jgi:hypothetical protein